MTALPRASRLPSGWGSSLRCHKLCRVGGEPQIPMRAVLALVRPMSSGSFRPPAKDDAPVPVRGFEVSTRVLFVLLPELERREGYPSRTDCHRHGGRS